MSRVTLSVDRLELALHGLPAAIGEDFQDQLECALRRRLAQLAELLPSAGAAFELGRLEAPRIEWRGAPDASALAGLVAEQLVELLAARARDTQELR